MKQREIQSVQPVMNGIGILNVVVSRVDESALSPEEYNQHRAYMSRIYRDYGFFGYSIGSTSVWELLHKNTQNN